jgi:hypothetical protein
LNSLDSFQNGVLMLGDRGCVVGARTCRLLFVGVPCGAVRRHWLARYGRLMFRSLPPRSASTVYRLVKHAPAAARFRSGLTQALHSFGAARARKRCPWKWFYYGGCRVWLWCRGRLRGWLPAVDGSAVSLAPSKLELSLSVPLLDSAHRVPWRVRPWKNRVRWSGCFFQGVVVTVHRRSYGAGQQENSPGGSVPGPPPCPGVRHPVHDPILQGGHCRLGQDHRVRGRSSQYAGSPWPREPAMPWTAACGLPIHFDQLAWNDVHLLKESPGHPG